MEQGLPLSGKVLTLNCRREHNITAVYPRMIAKTRYLTACFQDGVVAGLNVPAARYFSNWQALNRTCRRRYNGSGIKWGVYRLSVGY